MRTKCAVAALLILCLCLTGCSALQKLQISVAATASLVVSLEAAGKIPPATSGLILSAIAGLPLAYQQVTDEMATTDPAEVKAAKYWGYFGPSLKLLKLLPSEAQVWSNAVVTSIQVFLAVYPRPNPQLRASKRQGSPTAAVEQTKLDPIRVQAKSIDARLKALAGR